MILWRTHPVSYWIVILYIVTICVELSAEVKLSLISSSWWTRLMSIMFPYAITEFVNTLLLGTKSGLCKIR